MRQEHAARLRRRPVETVCNVLFCTAAATVLSLAMEESLAPGYFVVGYSIGFAVQACNAIGRAYGSRAGSRLVTRVATTGCGLVVGLVLGGTLLAGRPALLLADGAPLLIALLVGVMAFVGFELLKHLRDTRDRLLRAERDALARGKALAEAELRLQRRFSGDASAALDRERLASLLRRVADAPAHLRWLRVGHGERVEIVAVDDVCFFRSDHKYTAAVTRDREHLVRMPLAELAERLDPERFWRVHRGGIVNVAAIESARRDLRGRYRLTLKGRPEVLRVSAGYGHLFRRM